MRLAVDANEPGAQHALATLCESYWYPIYAYIRRSGHPPHDAEDLTQGFFQRLLEKRILAAADPEKGRLRTFLLTCLQRFMADEHDRAMAAKRGAGKITCFSSEWAEQHFAQEPVDEMSPDRLFQRRWALTVLEFTFTLLKQEYEGDGKFELFAAVRPFLRVSEEPEQSYETVASRLGMNLNTVKSHIRRLRERWREILFQQVGCTLDEPTPANIKAELAELLGCV